MVKFIDGQRHSITVPLIGWADAGANQFHVTEEMGVECPISAGHFIPDNVCFINGIPLVMIKAKQRVSSTKPTAMVEEGFSQHLSNQMVDGIEDLYAYSQLLLSVSGTESKYGTTDTKYKFWSKWTDEEIPEAEFQRIRSKRLSDAQKGTIFADQA